ncbi:LCCL domain-containing protein [Hasllibacter sp. MH4015]|uniref:LCCL domain-containing protein n=1 Tax=Hasllibacter sp. MH4015 TaxID=2854029 RepID=UPI001CD2650C|nr:LCCL domain-containing protein [Hasllibacter sp. MH4015]
MFKPLLLSAVTLASLAFGTAAGLATTGLVLQPSGHAQSTGAWAVSPDSLNLNSHGGTRTHVCPPGGSAHTIWGAGDYTSDSSICTAAVHAGHINFANGGRVTIQINQGLSSFAGATWNGVTSHSYGSWPRSFRVLGAQFVQPARVIGADTNLIDLGIAGQAGSVHSFICPPLGSVTTTIWGDGVYTSDSAICAAAVHAGRITASSGGRVSIDVSGGRQSYTGAFRNGVASQQYGPWSASFSFR